MKKIIISLAVLSILFSGINSVQGQQAVSEEAKRYFARGVSTPYTKIRQTPTPHSRLMEHNHETSLTGA